MFKTKQNVKNKKQHESQNRKETTRNSALKQSQPVLLDYKKQSLKQV
jgi:hypothetical protein